MALNRPLTGLILLASAAGGPYFLFETDAGRRAREEASQVFSVGEQPPSGWLTAGPSGGDSTDSGYWNANGLNTPQVMPSDGSTNMPAMPVHALRDVLRFDISPNWVFQRFERVTTVLSDLQLDGLRVPLITGTAPTDLAGTLSYYFDRYKRVQRVKIHALTGDPSRFIAELQHAYQLQQHPSLGGQLYLLKWNGRATSVVFAAPAPVITADAPYSRYNVFIELNQAGLEYGLSSEAQQMLDAGRQIDRWQ